MRSSKTPIRTVACVVGLGLMFVQAALAADKQPIRFNAADQAAAKAVTLKAADLGPGWKGGPKKPDLSQDDKCMTKVSDLVITGAASSKFQGPGRLCHHRVGDPPVAVNGRRRLAAQRRQRRRDGVHSQ